jgi:hypothetical protein
MEGKYSIRACCYNDCGSQAFFYFCCSGHQLLAARFIIIALLLLYLTVLRFPAAHPSNAHDESVKPPVASAICHSGSGDLFISHVSKLSRLRSTA